MSIQQHDGELLGAYVLGALDEEEQRRIEGHVAECEGCRVELEALRDLEATLGEVPPEAFLDGPPQGGDLMLRRTLRQVHAERSRSDGRRRVMLAVAASAVAAAVLGAGFLVGRTTADEGETEAVPKPPTISAPPVVPETKFGSGTDTATGARMAVRMTPTSDWVRVNAAVSGIPAGELCRLVVVSKDGKREVAGSWVVGNKEKGANLDGSAAVAGKDVKEVFVENDAGKRYVTASLV
ncbi:zf-HC2 domain-containing protein [Streptomyces sp. NPDC047315]|uniref:anti-sigma factor family protein n=1 Tax=Streptomyces sp. NPDC047315 TaxID=3155142 RepID=UPI0033E1E422